MFVKNIFLSEDGCWLLPNVGRELPDYTASDRRGQLSSYFYVLLTVHLSISLDNDQLDAHLLYFTIRLLQSSTCLEHYMLIIRTLNCIDAASGIFAVCQWPSGEPDDH